MNDWSTTPRQPVIVYGWSEWIDGNEWNIPDFCHVEPDTVGRYTGLKDRNGKRIFEGDIVLKRTYHGKKPFPVSYCDGMFHCGFGGGSSTPRHGYTLADNQIEVIGNIYDNPKLMEETK